MSVKISSNFPVTFGDSFFRPRRHSRTMPWDWVVTYPVFFFWKTAYSLLTPTIFWCILLLLPCNFLRQHLYLFWVNKRYLIKHNSATENKQPFHIMFSYLSLSISVKAILSNHQFHAILIKINDSHVAECWLCFSFGMSLQDASVISNKSDKTSLQLWHI